MLLKKINYCLIFLVIFCASSCVSGQTSSEDYFLKAYQCKDLDCQLQNLNKSIELNKNYAPAYWGRSYVYYFQNKHKLKSDDFNMVEKLSPNFSDVFVAYNKIIKLHPNNKYVLLIQGDLLSLQDKADEGLKLIEKVIEIDNKLPQAYYSKGYYFEYKQNNEKALEFFKKAIELDPEFANALHRYGSIYAHTTKDFKKGLEYLDKAIQLSPDFSSAYLARVAIYMESEQYEKAIPDITRYIELKPNEVQAYRVRAELYQKIGKIDLAEKDFQKLKELESKQNTGFTQK